MRMPCRRQRGLVKPWGEEWLTGVPQQPGTPDMLLGPQSPALGANPFTKAATKIGKRRCIIVYALGG